MDRNDRGIKPGGLNDPVARSIRNEQNRDAAPSKEEIEAEKKKDEVVHAQWKVIESLIDEHDWPSNYLTVTKLAEWYGFTELSNIRTHQWESRGRHNVGFKTKHEEKSEREPIPEEAKEHGQYVEHPPFDAFADMKRVSKLKSKYKEQADERGTPDVVDSVSKILNPFGASRATAVSIGGTIHHNDTWQKAMDRDNWSDRFKGDDAPDDTVTKYQVELGELENELGTA